MEEWEEALRIKWQTQYYENGDKAFAELLDAYVYAVHITAGLLAEPVVIEEG